MRCAASCSQCSGYTGKMAASRLLRAAAAAAGCLATPVTASAAAAAVIGHTLRFLFVVLVLAPAAVASHLATVTQLRYTVFGPRLIGVSRRGRREHAVLHVSNLSSWQGWAGRLPRSTRTTLLLQADRAARAQGILLHSNVGAAGRILLSAEHLAVVLAHQRRARSTFVSGRRRTGHSRGFCNHCTDSVSTLLAALLRWLRALLMPGDIDEWRRASDGALLAWTSTVVKGNTLRGMWFYTAEPQALLWFAALRLHVARGIAMSGVDIVDAGPSANAEVAALKATCGFVPRLVHAPGDPPMYIGEWLTCTQEPADNVLKLPSDMGPDFAHDGENDAQSMTRRQPGGACCSASSRLKLGAPSTIPSASSTGVAGRREAAAAKAERKAAKAVKRAARVAARHQEPPEPSS